MMFEHRTRPVYATSLWCARGHFNEQQAEKYAQLCQAVRPKRVLEIGFCTGRSAVSILHYTKNCVEKMVSVDKDLDWMAPEGRKMAALLERTFATFRIIEASSQDLLTPTFLQREFPKGIDLATIDGDHSYEACTADLEAVAPFLSRHGVMIVDDYRSGPPDGVRLPSVTESVDHFLTRHDDRLRAEVWNRSGKGFCIMRRVD